MYLIYNMRGGNVWCGVEACKTEDGGIRAGVEGNLNLFYPKELFVDVLEISDEEWESLDRSALNKYIVEDGVLKSVSEEETETAGEIYTSMANAYMEGVNNA